jgi:hypothetical protein
MYAATQYTTQLSYTSTDGVLTSPPPVRTPPSIIASRHSSWGSLLDEHQVDSPQSCSTPVLDTEVFDR